MNRRAPNGSSIIFGEGGERWMCYDPGSRVVQEANWQARHGGDAGKVASALTLASVVSAFAYFVNDCPTTTLACKKLAELRAAVRALPEPAAPPPPTEEGRGKP